MPDDERPRRRLGDETKERIADLASGWSLDGKDEPVAPASPKPAHTPTPKPTTPKPAAASSAAGSAGEPVPRKKPRTNPPPPPGSPERKALEDKIVELAHTTTASGAKPSPSASPAAQNSLGAKTSTSANPVAGEMRPKPPTAPPPVPAAPATRGDTTRSGPQFKRADYLGPAAPFATEGRTFSSEPRTPPVIVDDSATLPEPVAPVPSRSIEAAPSRPIAAPSTPLGAPPSRPIAAPSTPIGAAPSKPITAAPSTPIGAAPSKPIAAAPSNPIAAAPSKPITAVPSNPIAAAPSKPIATSPSKPSVAPPASPPPRLAVPVGEFDSGVQTIEQSTLPREALPTRPDDAQSTAKRDVAEALLKIPDTTTPVEELLDDDDDKPVRGDATMIDPQTAKFERGDPTHNGVVDATEIQAPSMRVRQHTGGTLRPSAALRRKRGLYGDVRYVFTALFGVRASRRELVELEHRQGLRQTSRRRHLVTLGRTAVITDTFDHPALGKAREQLASIEEERSKHAGAVAASDAELERVRRDREAKAKQYVTDLAATDAELADLAKKLEPLEKEAATAKKRGQELRESLQRIEKKIAETTALLDSVKAEKMDKAGIHADIATLKADRQAVLRDEPMLAAELDALNPRIAAIEATRNELRKKRGELEKAETEDQRRAAELLDAIGAKRKVVERAAADAETARDNAMFALGERLYVDRPTTLTAQLAPIDTIDLELGEGDRRMMELKEILSNIDKAKFARGMAMIILALAIVGLIAWLLLHALL